MLRFREIRSVAGFHKPSELQALTLYLHWPGLQPTVWEYASWHGFALCISYSHVRVHHRHSDRERQLHGRPRSEGVHSTLRPIAAVLCGHVWASILVCEQKLNSVLVICTIHCMLPTHLVFRSCLEIFLIFSESQYCFSFLGEKNGFLPETRQLSVPQTVVQENGSNCKSFLCS